MLGLSGSSGWCRGVEQCSGIDVVDVMGGNNNQIVGGGGEQVVSFRARRK